MTTSANVTHYVVTDKEGKVVLKDSRHAYCKDHLTDKLKALPNPEQLTIQATWPDEDEVDRESNPIRLDHYLKGERLHFPQPEDPYVDEITTAIEILDGNSEPIDWRDGNQPELLRKLCEHLEHYHEVHDEISRLKEGLEKIVALKDATQVRDPIADLVDEPGANADGFRAIHPRMRMAFAHASRIAQEVLEEQEPNAWSDEWPDQPGDYWFHGWPGGSETDRDNKPIKPSTHLVSGVLLDNGTLFFRMGGCSVNRGECLKGKFKKASPPEPPKPDGMNHHIMIMDTSSKGT